MTDTTGRDRYEPGSAYGAEIAKTGDTWTLVIVRDFAHPPERVWEAITDPAHLREWAPFDADRNLGTIGSAVLTTVGAPTEHVTESKITRADAPRALEFTWGGSELRWELERRSNNGTRLRLWHNIDRRFIAMGASGWHLCFDVLRSTLDGDPIGRTVGPDAFKVRGWHQLYADYATLLGVAPPSNESWGQS